MNAKKMHNKYPMPFVKWQDPKTLEKEGTAIGMMAMPKHLRIEQVTGGYGLFRIINEKDGLYFLVTENIDNSAVWSIKKKNVDVFI